MNEIKLQLPEWSDKLWERNRYKAVWGGRGSGKSWTVAQVLLVRGFQEKLLIACCREYQRNIAESSKRLLSNCIDRMGLRWFYTEQHNRIIGQNGTEFIFQGMSTSTEEGIRGLEGVDILYFEEAQALSRRTREILLPTIRKPGSELWFTFNPQRRSDPVWIDFCTAEPRLEGALSIKVNWYDNPWFPDELDMERQICQKWEPDRYNHVWNGFPDDTGIALKVLPYALLMECVEAWGKRDESGRAYVGLDVADSDGGGDKNALVVRRGGSVILAEEWSSSDQGATTRRADEICREYGATALYYDRQGVGAGVRTYLAEMSSRREPLPYYTRPLAFGDRVAGSEVIFSSRTTNKDFFYRRNAQLAWGLRLRALNTRRLISGDEVYAAACLFINPEIRGLEGYLAQLAQPEHSDTITGQVKIDKAPNDEASPDRYDATALAFARDSDFGLKQR